MRGVCFSLLSFFLWLRGGCGWMGLGLGSYQSLGGKQECSRSRHGWTCIFCRAIRALFGGFLRLRTSFRCQVLCVSAFGCFLDVDFAFSRSDVAVVLVGSRRSTLMTAGMVLPDQDKTTLYIRANKKVPPQQEQQLHSPPLPQTPNQTKPRKPSKPRHKTKERQPQEKQEELTD